MVLSSIGEILPLLFLLYFFGYFYYRQSERSFSLLSISLVLPILSINLSTLSFSYQL